MAPRTPIGPSGAPLVGRSGEVAMLDEALRAASSSAGLSTIEIVGEAGIGKTTLLEWLGASAARAGALVLSGRCSEFERDVPYALWIDALDGQLAVLPSLGEGDLAALGSVFPALRAVADGAPVERHRSHRAVRALLERLAAPRGLVLLLDDLHWADPASIALVASLVRRPSSARVLLAVAHRHRQVGSALEPELRRAALAGVARRLAPGPLTSSEARELLAGVVGAGEVGRLYAESGGNPFHLMALARAGRPVAGRDRDPGHAEVPEAVREAVLSETAPLAPDARALLDGAAIVGDPFEIDFAASVAGLSREAALAALDELVAADLVRGTDAVRRFRFRHPIVRRTVYESVGPGRRLAGHARAAEGLALAGAEPVLLAHHVEQSAAPGDAAAVELLASAAAQVAGRAPQTAVHWLTVARTLVQGPDRVAVEAPLLGPLAGALAGSGRFDDARRVLLEILSGVPEDSPERTGLIVACAAMERLLGDHDGARARLRAARSALADPGSLDAVALGVELAAHASLRGDPIEMRSSATEALAGAVALGDPTFMAAATAALAMAAYTLGEVEEGLARGREAAALVDALSDEQLGSRLEMLLFLGWSEFFLGEFSLALSHFSRGTSIARRAGSAVLALELMVGEALGLLSRGRIAEALDVTDAAVEDARPLGSAQSLIWALYAHATVLEAGGDPAAAVRAGEEAVALTAGLEPSSIVAACGAALARALIATGEGARAARVLLALQGGEDLPRSFVGERAGGYELLVRAALLVGDVAAAAAWAGRAGTSAREIGLPLALAHAQRARALVLLAGDVAAAGGHDAVRGGHGAVAGGGDAMAGDVAAAGGDDAVRGGDGAVAGGGDAMVGDVAAAGGGAAVRDGHRAVAGTDDAPARRAAALNGAARGG
ncbi:AAA family ATPase, partial [Solirubrobacter ginsenosidimutans]